MQVHHLIPFLAVVASPAFAQDASLQRCRGLSDPGTRLACYDGLADAASRQVAAPAAAGEAGFSLAEKRRQETPDAMQSAVSASFAGWGPNSRIRLDNGQVWQVIDGSSVALPQGARKVAVKRGALGSFYLELESLKTAPRVRRVE